LKVAPNVFPGAFHFLHLPFFALQTAPTSIPL
jgi:hypothetical protein